MLMNLSFVFYTEQSYSWGSVWQSEQNFNSQDALKKNKNTFGKSHTPLVFLSLDAQIFSWIFRTSLSSEHREAHSSTFCALDEFYANFLHLKSQIVHRFNAASHYTMWDGSKLLDYPTFRWLGWFFFYINIYDISQKQVMFVIFLQIFITSHAKDWKDAVLYQTARYLTNSCTAYIQTACT